MNPAVVIASWIVTVHPESRGAARRALGGIPGARLARANLADPWIVTTECAEEDFAALHRSLEVAPGVRTVSMVVAYRDREPEDRT